jgi:hypothetical protein
MYISREEIEVEEKGEVVKIEFKDKEINGFWYIDTKKFQNNKYMYLERVIYMYIKEQNIKSCYAEFF